MSFVNFFFCAYPQNHNISVLPLFSKLEISEHYESVDHMWICEDMELIESYVSKRAKKTEKYGISFKRIRFLRKWGHLRSLKNFLWVCDIEDPKAIPGVNSNSIWNRITWLQPIRNEACGLSHQTQYGKIPLGHSSAPYGWGGNKITEIHNSNRLDYNIIPLQLVGPLQLFIAMANFRMRNINCP